MFFTFSANAALVFLLTLLLQNGRGYSALETGLIFLPAGLGGITASIITPRIVKRIDFSKLIVLGLIIFGLGIYGLAKVGTISSVIVFMAIYYFTALGVVSVIISLSIAGTTGIESERQGLAAGLLTTAQQIGAAIGVGVASVVVATALLSEGATPPIRVESYRYALIVSEVLVFMAIILAIYLAIRRNHKQIP